MEVVVVERRDVDRLADAMGAASRFALDSLWDLSRSLEGVSAPAVRDAFLDAVPTLVAGFGDVAASAALQWYREQRELAAPGKDWEPDRLSDGIIDQAGMEAAVRYAAGKLWQPDGGIGAFTDAVAGRMDSWVKGYGRDTIMRNIAYDPSPTRWARVPRGAHTCAFCEMMASRGFVYLSQWSASAYHNDCDCQPVPSWDVNNPVLEGYDPDAMYERYLAARAALEEEGEASGDTRLILAKMRRMYPDQYKDGVDESKPKQKPGPKAGWKERRKEKDSGFNLKLTETTLFANDDEGISWANKEENYVPIDESEEGATELKRYSGETYKKLNKALRDNGEHGIPLPDDIEEMMHQIDKVTDSHPLPATLQLHRGTSVYEFRDSDGNVIPEDVDFDKLKILIEGTTQVNHSVTSTSIGTTPAFNRKRVWLHLTCPEGTPAVNLMGISVFGDKEREILLGRGIEYRIDRIEKGKVKGETIIHVYATVIGVRR